MRDDPLQPWPIEKWGEILTVLDKKNLDTLSGHIMLEYRFGWTNPGIDHDIQVYCPYADASNGMVAINDKNTAYEVILQCPKDKTDILVQALKETKIINWKRPITLPFTSHYIIECIKGLLEEDFDIEIFHHIPSLRFHLDKRTLPYQNISLPTSITFDLLTEEHIDLIDSCWPHRYPGSAWYFQLLIKAKVGYGLFENGKLVTWMFINEVGAITHVYTIESYRKRGLAEILLKIVCNLCLKDNKNVLVYCVATNAVAKKIYLKMGFLMDDQLAWHYLRSRRTAEISDRKGKL